MTTPPSAEYHWQLLPVSAVSNPVPEVWICSLKASVAEIAGNKWLKLQAALQRRQPGQGILSFGGAFSNHLAALAAAGHHYNFPTIGIVRTDHLDQQNPTLKRCQALGMQLKVLSRKRYRQQQQTEFLNSLKISYPHYLIIPEGGSDQAGAWGVRTLPLQQTPAGTADLLCCATASGGTLAGIISQHPKARCLGLAVVKDNSLPQRVNSCLPIDEVFNNWSIAQATSGYGKLSAELIAFCCQLKREHNISTEPVYTGKALYLLIELIKQGTLANVKRVAFFHSGGLQGLHGLYYRKLLTTEQYQLLAAESAMI